MLGISVLIVLLNPSNLGRINNEKTLRNDYTPQHLKVLEVWKTSKRKG